MENGTSFDDILNGSDEEEQEVAQPEVQIEQETGDTQETAQEEPPSSEAEPGHIPIAALKDERAKRQALEERFRQSEERLQQYDAYFAQQRQGAEQQEEPDPIEFITQQVMAKFAPQAELQALVTRTNVAEEFARQKWPDYDEKVELFKEAAKANPFLIQEMKGASNPAEYAYNVSQKIHEARTYGTAAPTREQIEAELREKILAESGIARPQAPTSLVNTQSRGSRGGPAWAGPSSMEDILRR